jgi:hypothetical protein
VLSAQSSCKHLAPLLSPSLSLVIPDKGQEYPLTRYNFEPQSRQDRPFCSATDFNSFIESLKRLLLSRTKFFSLASLGPQPTKAIKSKGPSHQHRNILLSLFILKVSPSSPALEIDFISCPSDSADATHPSSSTLTKTSNPHHHQLACATAAIAGRRFQRSIIFSRPQPGTITIVLYFGFHPFSPL